VLRTSRHSPLPRVKALSVPQLPSLSCPLLFALRGSGSQFEFAVAKRVLRSNKDLLENKCLWRLLYYASPKLPPFPGKQSRRLDLCRIGGVQHGRRCQQQGGEDNGVFHRIKSPDVRPPGASWYGGFACWLSVVCFLVHFSFRPKGRSGHPNYFHPGKERLGPLASRS